MKTFIRYVTRANGRKSPVYHIVIHGFDWTFGSLESLKNTMHVLGQKNLPPSPPGSDLSRLPGWVKSWRYREKALKGFQTALKQFSRHPQDAKGLVEVSEITQKKYLQKANSRAARRLFTQDKLKNEQVFLNSLPSAQKRRLRRPLKKLF
jgi:hypothetical protein